MELEPGLASSGVAEHVCILQRKEQQGSVDNQVVLRGRNTGLWLGGNILLWALDP